jgi:hypothetical protein
MNTCTGVDDQAVSPSQLQMLVKFQNTPYVAYSKIRAPNADPNEAEIMIRVPFAFPASVRVPVV